MVDSFTQALWREYCGPGTGFREETWFQNSQPGREDKAPKKVWDNGKCSEAGREALWGSPGEDISLLGGHLELPKGRLS